MRPINAQPKLLRLACLELRNRLSGVLGPLGGERHGLVGYRKALENFPVLRSPRLFGAEPPRARVEAVRIVDMSSSNAWAEFSNVFRRTRETYLEHENAKTELKSLMPEDAKEAIGHGLRAKRSKSGAVSFDLLDAEVGHAPLQ